MVDNVFPQQEQLTLGIRFRDDCDFAGFYVGDANLQAVEALKNLSLASAEKFIFMWGNEGAGCSHLLQAVCQQATQQGLTSSYLPLKELKSCDPVLLEDLESLDVICLDDIDVIADDSVWQEAIFHLFNRLRDHGCCLLVAGHQPPRQLPFSLADLVSRLCQGIIFQVFALSDEEKNHAFMQRAKKRGLVVSEEVMQFIATHVSRQSKDLFHLLDQLDRRSLQAQRRLTIPFVKEVIGAPLPSRIQHSTDK